MLFDLQSPGRRRVIKVIYGTLAVLMGGGLIFFGIGSDATGGLSDIFTGGGDDPSEQFSDQIEDAEQLAAESPNDPVPQAELVQLYYQQGNGQLEVNEETGQQTFTSDAEESYTKAANAWDRYVKLSNGKPDSSTALLAVQAFSALANGALNEAGGGSGQEALDSADDALTYFESAGEAQRTIAGQSGNPDDFATVAQFLYFAGDAAGGDAAAQEAIAAAKGGQANQLQRQLEQVEKRGNQLVSQIDDFRKQLAKAGAQGGGATGENPLSDLGGGGGSLGGGAGGALATP
ncbi:MAG: hypothetical protein ACRDKH_00070 [Solirubrobacterales bacterium]